jgi:hypothetical protein
MIQTLNVEVHDSHLESYAVGPRNELVVTLYLDRVWNEDGPVRESIRFGAIENMEEVQDFFESLGANAKEGGFIDEVLGLRNEGEGVWILSLDRFGAIRILSRKMVEGWMPA